jgi:hypothetical protein
MKSKSKSSKGKGATYPWGKWQVRAPRAQKLPRARLFSLADVDAP